VRFARLAILPAIALLAALPLSCALSGFERVAETTDAGVTTDASHDVAPDAPMMCTHTSPPSPPTGTIKPGDVTFVVALHSIFMAEQAGSTPVGLDLDKTCTCEGEGPSCTAPKGTKPACDSPGGVDAAAQKLFQLIALPLGTDAFGSQFFSNGADKGLWSLLVRVTGYNGEADDDHVSVALFPVASSVEVPATGIPAWDGKDQWPISTTSLADGKSVSKPLYVDDNAYVSGGVLVAGIAHSEIRFAGSIESITMRLTGGQIVATLTKGPNGYALKDGILAARWALPDVFFAISSFRDNNGKAICTNGVDYAFAKQSFCNAADILSTIGTITTPCDALSLGLGFTADPANIGSVKPPPKPIPGCPPKDDPATDHCD
jgi:hypothetical protein